MELSNQEKQKEDINRKNKVEKKSNYIISNFINDDNDNDNYNELNKLKNENENLLSEIDNYKKIMKVVRINLRNEEILQNKVIEQAKIINEYQEKIIEMENNLKTLNKENKELKGEILILQQNKKHISKEYKRKKEILNGLQDNHEQLVKELNDFKKEKNKLNNEIKILKMKNKEINALKREIIDKEEKINLLESELKVYKLNKELGDQKIMKQFLESMLNPINISNSSESVKSLKINELKDNNNLLNNQKLELLEQNNNIEVYKEE